MDTNTLNLISKVDLFKKIPLAQIEDLFSRAKYSIKKIEKGKLFRLRGDEYNSLLIIIEGKAVAEISGPGGKNLKVETLAAPAPVATAILFAANNALPVNLRAESKVTVLDLSLRDVLAFCQKDEHFLTAYLRDTGNKVTFLADKIKFFQFNTIKQKIAVYLMDLKRRQQSDTIIEPYTKETLAEIFGVTRPSLSRCFSQLVEEGIISQEGKKIIIHDSESLMDFKEE